jgi:hypothetical protein
MFCLPAVIAVLQSAILYTKYGYETPIYALLNMGDEREARRVLSKDGKDDG